MVFGLLAAEAISESTAPAWGQVETESYSYPKPPGNTNLLWITVEGAPGDNGSGGSCTGDKPESSGPGGDAPNLTFNISGAETKNRYVGGLSAGGVGGNGGNGGSCYDGRGGSSGGNAGIVKINLSDNAQIINNINAILSADGDPYIFGVIGSALAGNGGDGGSSDLDPGNGGSGGMTEPSAESDGAGTVEVVIDKSSSITTRSTLFSVGAIGQSAGGQGGDAGDGTSWWSGSSDGGNGGYSGPVSIQNDGSIELTLTGGLDGQGAALLAQSVGGQGGNSSDNSFSFVTYGNTAGSGGKSDVVSIRHRGVITTTGTNAIGINAQSVGGGGGSVPSSVSLESVGGDSGGAGGDANNSSVDVDGGRIHTYGDYGIGVLTQSIGGGGGSVGGQTSLETVGSEGGGGGSGEEASITLQNGAFITTGLPLDGSGNGGDGQGQFSPAVVAQSIGGGGGNAGTNSGVLAVGSDGGEGGDGGPVIAQLGSATLTTARVFSPGLLLQSIGGGGGNGGNAQSASVSSDVSVGGSSGGDGGPGGNGGQVQISKLLGTTQIQTRGAFSGGMLLQSIGGSGGSGGSATSVSAGVDFSSAVAIGGTGGTGGAAGAMLVGAAGTPVSATVSTTGFFSPGIQLQTVGGGGGSGGDANAYSAGGSGSASVAVGGSGGTGGDGGAITSYLASQLQTSGFQSPALSLASIGGGGGSGGSSHSASASIGFSGSLAVGGSGGDGGSGQTISSGFQGALLTRGDFSPALDLTNIGGGGGNGGMSLSLSAGGIASAAPAVGGTAGGGGNAGSSDLSFEGTASTFGQFAPAISARSIGGGGGNGGFALSASAASTASVATAVGGSGESGGDGGEITASINTSSVLQTTNLQSPGLHLQSIGGGGGNGGGAVSGSVAISPYPNASASVAVGGSGAGGGDGGDINLTFDGAIYTGRTAVLADDITTPFSSGILAQSIGGGGGTGGFSAALGASISAGSSFTGNVAIGGSGGAGGDGGTVNATPVRFSRIETKGRFSSGIQLQSIGGGGGDGGSSASLSLTASPESSWNGSVAIGGNAGNGGDGGDVSLAGIGDLISTNRAFSPGAFLQSIGGGGGSGGTATTLLATGGSSALSGGVAVGGTGGSGGSGGDVDLQLAASIQTSDQHAPAVVVQSIGGGGGKGGSSFSGSISGSTSTSFNGTASVGGNGSGGGSGGNVDVTTTGRTLSSTGAFSPTLLSQSVGGGGGNGGSATNLQATFTGSKGYTLGPTIGGQAGSGGDAGSVTVFNTASLTTGRDSAIRSAHFSPGILAQAIGGGGGNGGSALSGSLTLNLSGSGSSTSSADLGSSVGGNGGGGGNGGAIQITNANPSATTTTDGHFSPGISGQSIGGGGGDGGSSQSGSLALTGASQITAGVVVGGNGAQAGNGGAITILNSQAIGTGQSSASNATASILGHFSPGILAQSVGGGGGSGGSSLSTTLSVANVSSTSSSSSSSMALIGAATVGGRGGSGGDGGTISVVNEASSLVTRGSFSAGVQAQSIGGGGGSGGNATTRMGAIGSASSTGTVAIGGNGGGGGDGAGVSLRNKAAISTGLLRSEGTRGSFSPGLIAQSIGGGGGTGGNASTDQLTHNTSSSSGENSSSFYSLGVSLGGKGGSGGSGGSVLIQTSHPSINTHGAFSAGVVAQSIGGGGGNGGNSSLINRTESNGATAITGGLSLGGVGGDGGQGGDVRLELLSPLGSNRSASGGINTKGAYAFGLIAQSIGGGGGAGGSSVSTNESTSKSGSPSDVNRSGAIRLGGLGGQDWGSGGQGATGGSVAINGDAQIQTSGVGATAFLAQSIGGGGGAGGDVTSTVNSSSDKSSRNQGFVSMALGGEGGAGQSGGNVTWTSTDAVASSLTTAGVHAYGALLQSIGGGGGMGGSSTQNADISAPSTYSFGGFGSSGGTGGDGADGGNIQIGTDLSPLVSNINTSGTSASGLVVQSIGGGGGAGGGSTTNTTTTSTYGSSLSFGGAGGDGGNSGGLKANTRLEVLTRGIQAPAVVFQAIGGGGGLGGNASSSSATTLPEDSKAKASLSFGSSAGGEGGGGGEGGAIDANISGELATRGAGSDAVVVQSIGGGGGSGGNATTTTSLEQSSGSGSLPVALSFGGRGGNGGNGGSINFNSTTGIALATIGNNAQGLSLQSIGGGGGRGGNVSSLGSNGSQTDIILGASIGIGATGGGGGDGGSVTIGQRRLPLQLLTQTRGSQAPGLLIQSIGGGGGSGSNTSSGATSGSIGASFGLGGSGGSGGQGNSVQVIADLTLNTSGPSSTGALLQSIGGGGGQGGSVTSDVTADASEIDTDFTLGLSAAVGGNGGGGGNAGSLDATLGGEITTTADRSTALSIQAIGGGGGDAGEVISGAKAEGAGRNASLGFALGGQGGNGGNGGSVTLSPLRGTDLVVQTEGDGSSGVSLQSIGGGGGSASSVQSLSSASGEGSLGVSLSIGAQGGSGGSGGSISSKHRGLIRTSGTSSHALMAQSIGGGGGQASAIQSGLTQGETTINGVVGGQGGNGGNAGTINVDNQSRLLTLGDNALGLLLQSVGGGGGISSVNVRNPGAAQSLNGQLRIGGSGGEGGSGNDIQTTNSGLIQTTGSNAHAVMLQSIGGGGGHSSIQAGPAASASAFSVNLGGSGGQGGDGGTLVVNNTGRVITSGAASHGLLALSIGGGGGSVSSRGPVNASLGSSGGGGGNGGSIRIENARRGRIEAQGTDAIGILAISIGGGGGFVTGTSGDVSYGSTGGDGGDGGDILIRNLGTITASGTNAVGVLARSIGGGGGFSSANLDEGDLSLGSSQASRGDAGEVVVINRGNINAKGDGARAMLVGAIAGGGGDAGDNYGFGQLGMTSGGASGRKTTLTNNADLRTDGNNAAALQLQSIGGGGGTAASLRNGAHLGSTEGSKNQSGANVSLDNNGNLVTRQNQSAGLIVQSIGGGGGHVNHVIGNADLGATTTRGPIDASGGDIQAESKLGAIITTGRGSPGIMLQSIGGGGGWVGVTDGNVSMGSDNTQGQLRGGGLTLANRSAIRTEGAGSLGIIAQSIGGGGGYVGFSNGTIQLGANNSAGLLSGGSVELNNRGTIQTVGSHASGVLAQSIGGGGGALNAANPTLVMNSRLGADARQEGNSGNVLVTNNARSSISTGGNHAPAMVAQSIGGGGGYSMQNSRVVSMGLETGTGSAGRVDFINRGSLRTQGAHSHGVLAQSIGGGGGVVRSGNSSVSLGGSEGASGSANGVTIDNRRGSILTSGRHAIPVVGQSIGGGGGWMGSASGEIRLGASGATGDGGDVELNNINGVIQSSGAFSPAFLLQSVGGGGGHLGSASLRQVNADHAEAALSTPAILGGGLQGSSGSGGGLILRNGSGEISTSGAFSAGMVHQTIGGGGGWVGSITDGDLQLGGRSVSRVRGASVDLVIPMAIRTIGPNSTGVLLQSIGGGGGAAAQVLGAARLGGEADSGSDARGGNLRFIQQQPITTAGIDSPALLLQSIGGGGGRVAAVTGATELGATVKPRVNSSAGAIDGIIDANIRTTGDRSPGVVLQSIGGGGGYAAGSNSTTLGASLAEPGSSSSKANSGDITLTNTANLRTTGQQSIGILIQSIADGGGVAGSNSGRIEHNRTGLASESGAILMNNRGSITTTGERAHAVVAQTISGGGGYVLGGTNASTSDTTVVSPRGRSGGITINNDGLIQTRGSDAIAVLAQSAINGAVISQNTLSGPDQKTPRFSTRIEPNTNTSVGRVIVRNSGVIRATGQGGIGITKSTNTNADDTNLRVINARGALIQGGPGGAAIQLPTPEKESILNRGLIIGGPRGQNLAIEGIGGNDEVINSGLIAGNIQITGTESTIVNNPNSRIESDSISLGLRSELINRGVLSPNGSHRLGSLDLTAKYLQTETGSYEFDLDLSENETDQLIINNPSALQGSMVLTPIRTGLAKPGQFVSTDFISAPRLREGDLKFIATNTAIASYEMISGSDPNNSLAVSYQIDYSPKGLNPNSKNVGEAFNTIQLAGPNSAQQRLTAAYLYQIPNVHNLNKTYQQLSGEQLTAFPQSIIQFSRAQQQANQEALDGLSTGFSESCPRDESKTPTPSCRRWSTWFQSDGFSMNANGTGSSDQSSWSSQAYNLSLGVSYTLSEKTTAGLIAQQATIWTNTSGLDAQGTTDLWNGSAFVKQRLSPKTLLSLQIGGGKTSSIIQREVNLPISTTEQSRPDGTIWQGSAQLSHTIDLNEAKDASLTPKLSVGWINYDQPGFREKTKSFSSSWARPTGRFEQSIDPNPSHSLSIDEARATSIPIKVQLDYQQDFTAGDITITPQFSVGYTADVGDRSRQQTATFSDEPNAPFLIQGSDAPQSWWDLNAAVNIELNKTFSFFLNLEADIAPALASTMRYGGGFRLRF